MKSVSIFVVLILIGIVLARANSSDARTWPPDPHQTVTQKPVVQIAGEGEGEVDRLLKRLTRKREVVLAVGPEHAPRESPTEGVGSRTIVEAAVVDDTPINAPKPEYSLMARAAHASGSVVVEMIFDETGRVIAAQAVSGHPLLIPAAVKAARQFRIAPASYKGKPVKAFGTIRYNFSL